MRSNLLPHALNREFPELAAAVAHLKESDLHFANLLKKHDAVDDQITADETGVAPMGDAGLEEAAPSFERRALSDGVRSEALREARAS